MFNALLPGRIAGHPVVRRLIALWLPCRLAVRGGAIANNVALLVHAYFANLPSLLLLYAVLLPVNTYRLARLLRAREHAND